jgi:putative ABC transport system ATP-binding protein
MSAEPAGPPLLAIDGLRFRWPGAAQDTLDIPALHFQAGEQVFVHGPSGCGKSTLLSLLAGVLIAQQGRVAVNGLDWARAPSSRRDAWRADQLGIVFQQFNLLPYLSVRDNVMLPCRFSRARAQRATASHGSAAQAVAHWLAAMGLPSDLWVRPASTLSVGQQQRVAAARALMGQPALVLADEPTSALDEARRGQFMDLLQGACSSAGSALLFVSHDQRLAARFPRHLALPEVNRAAASAQKASA